MKLPRLPDINIISPIDRLHGHARHGALVPLTWHNIPARHIQQLLRRYHITLYGGTLRIERHGATETWVRTAYVNPKQAASPAPPSTHATPPVPPATPPPRPPGQAIAPPAPPPSPKPSPTSSPSSSASNLATK